MTLPAISQGFCKWLIRTIVDVDLAERLTERCTDFGPVHTLIEEWEPFVA